MTTSSLPTKMCDACYGYIYDTLWNPLPQESPFHVHIHRKSLERTLPKITQCFLRACTPFRQSELFFILPNSLEHDDPFVKSQNYGEFIWKKYHILYPQHAQDLQSVIELLIDNGVIRKTTAHHQLAEIYTQYQFHTILRLIQEIHREHTNKVGMVSQSSLGPVPIWKIAMLKAKASGETWKGCYKIQVPMRPPPPPPSPLANQKLLIQIPKSIDDDPLYW